jgi:phage tail sheath gpL-like
VPIVIGGFSPDDKVPGFYGQVQFGTAGQSFAGQPIALLLVGLMISSGTLVPNTQVQQIFQDSDIDTLAGGGAGNGASELAVMGYEALAEQTDIPIFLASPALPGGAVAATCTLLIGGSWSTGGTIGVRIAGAVITVDVGPNDTISAVCTNVAAAINGENEGRLPFTATATSTTVVITCATPSVRGDQYVIFLQPSSPTSGIVWPSGITLSLTGVTWSSGQSVTTSTYNVPTVPNGYYYKVTTAGSGTTGTVQPTWPTTIGTATSADSNGVIWTCWGAVLNGGGINPGGGSGLETYTALITTLNSMGYGRLAIAANDATSAAAWLAKLNTDSGPLIGHLEHATIAVNSTLTAAASLAQTTLNNQRFCVPFLQSSETHPSALAAMFAADRAFWEVIDPNKNWDGFVLPNAAPQSQVADQPVHATKVAALNEGVTICTTVNNQVEIVRGITTKSLTNSQPDYSTLDLGFAVTPDFVLFDLKGVWNQFSNPVTGNSRLQDNPPPGAPKLPSGVADPSLWNSTITAELLRMQSGQIPGTCDPILVNVENNLPISALDTTTVGRLMSAVPVDVMPNLHQVGVSVQQL